VFDAVTGEVKRVFDEFAGKVNAIALSADGAHLATSTLENGPQLWDVATGKLKREFAFRARSFPDTLIFSPDGEWLVIPGSCTLQGECRIAIFRVATGELQWEIGTRAQDAVGPWSTFAFSPDSSILYTASQRLEAWALKP